MVTAANEDTIQGLQHNHHNPFSMQAGGEVVANTTSTYWHTRHRGIQDVRMMTCCKHHCKHHRAPSCSSVTSVPLHNSSSSTSERGVHTGMAQLQEQHMQQAMLKTRQEGQHAASASKIHMHAQWARATSVTMTSWVCSLQTPPPPALL
jgi:hypothetical protein